MRQVSVRDISSSWLRKSGRWAKANKEIGDNKLPSDTPATALPVNEMVPGPRHQNLLVYTVKLVEWSPARFCPGQTNTFWVHSSEAIIGQEPFPKHSGKKCLILWTWPNNFSWPLDTLLFISLFISLFANRDRCRQCPSSSGNLR